MDVTTVTFFASYDSIVLHASKKGNTSVSHGSTENSTMSSTAAESEALL